MKSTAPAPTTPESGTTQSSGSSFKGAAALGLIAGLACLFISWREVGLIGVAAPPGALMLHLGYWLSGLSSLLTQGGLGTERWAFYTEWLAALDPPSLRWGIYARAGLAVISAIAVAVLTYRWAEAARRQQANPVRGRNLYRGTEALKRLVKEAAQECQRSKPGILMHPSVGISEDRETKHFLVMGATGSGKTQVIWHLIKQAKARGDHVFVFDTKGDFTRALRWSYLLAPWDQRSRAWDIASDCSDLGDARDLAARLIPDNDKDPMWPNASRQVLVALIRHLQETQPGRWKFEDLAALLRGDLDSMRRIAEAHNPEAVRALEEGSKTTQSVLINLMAFMAPVFDLARAAQPGHRAFSIRTWLQNTNVDKRIVVMQASARHQQLSRAYGNALISTLCRQIISPQTPTDPQRRVWLFLDEFPQLGRVSDIGTLIEVGRSKGLRIVIGVQDVAQLFAIYGLDTTNAWTSSISTSIYTRLAGGDTAEWVSRRIGMQERREIQRSVSSSKSGKSEGYQHQLRMTPTVLATELQTKLGVTEGGIEALVDGFNSGVYQIQYPFAQLTKYHRPHAAPAAPTGAAGSEDAARAVSTPVMPVAAPAPTFAALDLPEADTARAASTFDDPVAELFANQSPPVPEGEESPPSAPKPPRRWRRRTSDEALPP